MPTCGTVAASPETHSACALIGWCTQPRVAGQLDSHSEGLLHRCSLDSRSPLPCLPPPAALFWRLMLQVLKLQAAKEAAQVKAAAAGSKKKKSKK